MAHQPKLDPEKVREQIDNLSRAPFRDALAKILGAMPSEEAISAQAERYPDRWAQLCTMIAKLSGYSEKLDIQGSVVQQIQQLSDSELEARLEALRSLDTQSSVPASAPADPDQR